MAGEDEMVNEESLPGAMPIAGESRVLCLGLREVVIDKISKS